MPTIPPRPPNYANGVFAPLTGGQSATNRVLSLEIPVTDTLTASISGGEPDFSVGTIESFNVVLEAVDSSGELKGPPRVILVWDTELVGTAPNTLSFTAGQRADVLVTLTVPPSAAPGTISAVLTLAGGGGFSRSLNLQATVIGVNFTSPIGLKWAQMGGQAFFGNPLGNEHSTPDGTGVMQEFSNGGALYETAGGQVYYMSPRIYSKWHSPEVAQGKTGTGANVQAGLGQPIEDTFKTREGGEAMRLTSGAIVSRAFGPAYAIYGAIYAHYLGLGGNVSGTTCWGLPTSDEEDSALWGPRVVHFDEADFYWSAADGAYEIHGAILQLYNALGGGASQLGAPQSDETTTPDNTGRFNVFDGGVIYWSAALGAHVMFGPILQRWQSLGGEKSYLGYPVSDVSSWTNPVSSQLGQIVNFQYGQIGYTVEDGIVELPETYHFSQQVLTPSGTALGGTVDLTVQSNGAFQFTGHMHDSGLDSYSFTVRAVLAGANVGVAAQRTGSVGGTIGSGSRDFDWDESGNQPLLTANWTDVRACALVLSKSYEDTGALGVIEDAAKAFVGFLVSDVFVGPELALVISLGSEIAEIAKVNIAGPGALTGVVVAAGVAIIWGPSAWVPALVAGVASGLVTDALIQHQPLSQAERQFCVDNVFGDTLPGADQIIKTNLSGPGTNCFTMPNVDGTILMHLGNAYDSPTTAVFPGTNYALPGQVFIHEMTHVWQIFHEDFIPASICQALSAKIQGNSAYTYGPPGQAWKDFGTEQQGAIVDQWFGGNWGASGSSPAAGYGFPQKDHASPFYPYIVNNINMGQV